MSFRNVYLLIITIVFLFSVALSEGENTLSTPKSEKSLDISLEKVDDSYHSMQEREMYHSLHRDEALEHKREFHKRMGLKKMHNHGASLREEGDRKGVWGEIRHDSNPKNHHHHKNEHKDTWMDGFVHSTIMIVSMEFMDKTFFISAIMAMSHNKWVILLGSVAALFLMNGISCLMGVVLPMFMSRKVTIIVAAVLFIFFGGKMILDGIRMDSNDTGELDEAQEEIESAFKPANENATEDSPLLVSPTTEAKMCKPQDSVIIQIFLMIFFAEWGDRSQVSTILLAGTHPVLSVFLGGCVGYFITSFVAVLCGSVLQKYISPRWITIIGGCMFLGFAFQTLLGK